MGKEIGTWVRHRPPGSPLLRWHFLHNIMGKKRGNFWDCFASRSVRSVAHGIPSWSQEALTAIVGGGQGWFPLSFLQMGKSNFKSYSKVAEK